MRSLLPRLDLNAKHLHSLDVSSCKSVSSFHSVAQQAAIPVSVQLLSTRRAVAGVLQLEAGYRAAIFVCALRSLSTMDLVEDVIRRGCHPISILLFNILSQRCDGFGIPQFLLG